MGGATVGRAPPPRLSSHGRIGCTTMPSPRCVTDGRSRWDLVGGLGWLAGGGVEHPSTLGRRGSGHAGRDGGKDPRIRGGRAGLRISDFLGSSPV